MSGKQFSTLTVFSITGLVSALWILATCQPTPPESPTPTLAPTPVPTTTPVGQVITPVPIATWEAQGIPADTRIYYHYYNDFIGSETEIEIIADGSAKYYSKSHYGDTKPQLLAGQLSAEALKRVVLAFEEYGFVNLVVDSNGCVIDMTRPPPPSATLVEKTDAGYSSISITINGTSKTLRYYNGYSYSDYDDARGLAVLGVLVSAVEDLPAATPTASP